MGRAMAITRALALGIAAMATVALLAACTPTKETTMKPHEARDALVDTIHETAALLTVDGWKDTGAPGVQACDADGVAGVKYAYTYTAPAGGDHRGDADTVAAHWRGLGMTVRTETDPDAVVFATGGPVQGLSFSTAPGDYVISGTSLCVPGDIGALTDEQAG